MVGLGGFSEVSFRLPNNLEPDCHADPSCGFASFVEAGCDACVDRDVFAHKRADVERSGMRTVIGADIGGKAEILVGEEGRPAHCDSDRGRACDLFPEYRHLPFNQIKPSFDHADAVAELVELRLRNLADGRCSDRAQRDILRERGGGHAAGASIVVGISRRFGHILAFTQPGHFNRALSSGAGLDSRAVGRGCGQFAPDRS